MAEIGSVIAGKYEILTEIGHGGMSVVYLAMDTHLNKQWAVKEIRKKGNGRNDEVIVNSLLAEANMMKRLDHPSLPRIVDIIDNGVTIFVVMDYIEGESLDKILLSFFFIIFTFKSPLIYLFEKKSNCVTLIFSFNDSLTPTIS